MIDHARNVQYTVVYSARLIQNEVASSEHPRESNNKPENRQYHNMVAADADVDYKKFRKPKVGLRKIVKNVSENSMNLTENAIFSKKLNEKLSKVDRVALPWKLVSR